MNEILADGLGGGFMAYIDTDLDKLVIVYNGYKFFRERMEYLNNRTIMTYMQVEDLIEDIKPEDFEEQEELYDEYRKIYRELEDTYNETCSMFKEILKTDLGVGMKKLYDLLKEYKSIKFDD